MKKIIKKHTAMLAMLAALSLTGTVYAADSADTALSSSATFPAIVAKVNINTADANNIAGRVKGIGEKRAEAIVAYRTQHGAYKSFDDLADVKGIGEAFVKTHRNELNQAFTLS